MGSRLLFTATALAWLSFLSGCGGGVPVEDLGTRAVVIGIDGAEWRIMDPMLRAGKRSSWLQAALGWRAAQIHVARHLRPATPSRTPVP